MVLKWMQRLEWTPNSLLTYHQTDPPPNGTSTLADVVRYDSSYRDRWEETKCQTLYWACFFFSYLIKHIQQLHYVHESKLIIVQSQSCLTSVFNFFWVFRPEPVNARPPEVEVDMDEPLTPVAKPSPSLAPAELGASCTGCNTAPPFLGE